MVTAWARWTSPTPPPPLQIRVRPYLWRGWVVRCFGNHGVLSSCPLSLCPLSLRPKCFAWWARLGGFFRVSCGCISLSAVHGSSRFVSLGCDIVPVFCFWLPRHLNLMLGNSRVGSLTRDLWKRCALQVLRLWDCLAGVQCETSPRPLWGNDGGWSRGTSAKLHCLTCDVPR